MKTQDVVNIGLFAALMTALGAFPPIVIPLLGVPITAQSMGVMIAGGVLGAKRGAFAVLLFLVLVACGLPLLAGGRGGIGVFLAPAGGFFIGWVVGAFATGWFVEKLWSRLNYLLAFCGSIFGGVLVMYAIAIPWMALWLSMPILKVCGGVLIFIPGCLVKACVASALIVNVKRAYPLITSADGA